MDAEFEPRRRLSPAQAARFAGLAVIGGVSGYFLGRAADLPRDLPWDDGLAFIMGAALLTMAILVVIALLFRPSAVPKGTGLVQVLVFALAGLMFLAPMLATEWVSPQTVFAGVVAAFLIQTVGNVIAWRRSDEMMRRIMTETATVAFWGLQSAFFLYAVAERLGLIAPVSAWGMAGILMALYLISSIVPSMRRGIA